MDGLFTETSYVEYRENQINEGIKYQDFICVELQKRGIVLQNMQSKEYQYKEGENLLGLEIKLDKKLEETGRIYIETHEKAMPRSGDYVLSGINRKGCWLYGIGNYKIFFIFGIKTLKRLLESNPPFLYWPKKNKDTSKGFCIPTDKAKHIAEIVIEF